MTATATPPARPSAPPFGARGQWGGADSAGACDVRRAAPARARYAVHGPAVEVENHVAGFLDPVARLLGPFAVAGWPEGFVPVQGIVRPYDPADVLRRLSPTARPVPPAQTRDLAEVYEEGGRFWVVDERWGMAEINFLKGQWRSWVLPRPQFDPVRCAEAAVLWPLAQLLRPRGLCLVPAAAVVRDGWSALILCPFGVEPELTALVRSGYKLVSQRWTAIREEDGRLALLHMPAPIQRSARPQLRSRPGVRHGNGEGEAGVGGCDGEWVDLLGGTRGAGVNHTFCDAVLVAGPCRRAHAGLKELHAAPAAALLRQAWPVAELHPSRRHSPLPLKLAQRCRCAELQLSRDPTELLPLLELFRTRGAARGA